MLVFRSVVRPRQIAMRALVPVADSAELLAAPRTDGAGLGTNRFTRALGKSVRDLAIMQVCSSVRSKCDTRHQLAGILGDDWGILSNSRIRWSAITPYPQCANDARASIRRGPGRNSSR